jgi:spermidine synthase
VVRIARDPALFSFLQDSAGTVETVLADGRIGLAAQPDGHFDLIAMDAFSSDSIPVHLLTREALEIVLRKLRPGAVAAYHLSSSFFELAPVIAEAAAALGKEGLFWYDQDLAPAALAVGKLPSAWVVVAASAADLEPLRSTGPWQPLSAQRRTSGGPWLWTDRYSSPLAALRR